MSKEIELYQVISYKDGLPYWDGVYDHVPVYWLAVSRDEPLVDVRKVIIGYDKLADGYEEFVAQQYAEEGLTLQEIEVLRPWIEQISYGIELYPLFPITIGEDRRFPYTSHQELIPYALNPPKNSDQMRLRPEFHSFDFHVECYWFIDDGELRESKK